jgi:hypothetical protein
MVVILQDIPVEDSSGCPPVPIIEWVNISYEEMQDDPFYDRMNEAFRIRIGKFAECIKEIGDLCPWRRSMQYGT